MAAIEAPTDFTSLKNKSVIVTGGASGLGLAVATKFVAEGAYVTIADVNDELGHSLAKKLSGHVSYVHCDVVNWESAVAAFKHAVNFGPNKTLDIAFLSAGVFGDAKNLVEHVVQGGEASLEHDPKPPNVSAITVNLIGEYNTACLALNYMRLKGTSHTNGSTNGTSATPKKSLVLIASLAGYVDYGNTAYGAGKFGVRGMFRSMRSKTEEVNVRCNLIAPWFVDTPMTGGIKEHLKEAGIEQGKGFTFAPIDNVTAAVAHCAIDDSVHGRAFGIMPEGFFDLDDDIEKGHGGQKVLELISKRMEAGDQII